MATLAHCLGKLGYKKGQTSAEMDRLVDRVYSALNPPMSEDAKVQQDAVAAVIRDYESDLDMLRTALGMKVQPLTKPVPVEPPAGPTMAGREVPKVAPEPTPEPEVKAASEAEAKAVSGEPMTTEEVLSIWNTLSSIANDVDTLSNPGSTKAEQLAAVVRRLLSGRETATKRSALAEKIVAGKPADEASVIKKMLAGEVLNDKETKLSVAIHNKYIFDALRGDPEAMAIVDAYSDAGTLQGKALAQRRQVMMSPIQIIVNDIYRNLNDPGPGAGKLVDELVKINKETTEAEKDKTDATVVAEDQAGKIKELEAEVEKLTALVKDQLAEMKKQGAIIDAELEALGKAGVEMSVADDLRKEYEKNKAELEAKVAELSRRRELKDAKENEAKAAGERVKAKKKRVKEIEEELEEEKKDLRKALEQAGWFATSVDKIAAEGQAGIDRLKKLYEGLRLHNETFKNAEVSEKPIEKSEEEAQAANFQRTSQGLQRLGFGKSTADAEAKNTEHARQIAAEMKRIIEESEAARKANKPWDIRSRLVKAGWPEQVIDAIAADPKGLERLKEVYGDFFVSTKPLRWGSAVFSSPAGMLKDAFLTRKTKEQLETEAREANINRDVQKFLGLGFGKGTAEALARDNTHAREVESAMKTLIAEGKAAQKEGRRVAAMRPGNKLRKILDELGYGDGTIEAAVQDPRKGMLLLRDILALKNTNWDRAFNYYVDAILSAQRTANVNIAGGTAFTTYKFGLERLIQGALNDIRRKLGWQAGNVSLKDVGNFWRSLLSGWTEAKRNAVESYTQRMDMFAVNRELPIMSRAQMLALAKASPNTTNIISKLVSMVSSRQRIAADSFIKSLVWNMELAMQAEIAGREKGLEGKALMEHIANTYNDPNSEAYKKAVEAAKEATMADEFGTGAVTEGDMESKVWEGIGKLGSYVGKLPLLRYLTPFARFTTTLSKITLRRVGPLAVFRAVRAYKQMRADPTRKNVDTYNRVLSENIAGVLSAAAFMSLLRAIRGDGDEPYITGGENAGEYAYLKSMGKTVPPPYSFRIGKTWYSYANLDPLGSVLGVFVDIAKGNPTRAYRQLGQKSYLKTLTDVMEITSALFTSNSDQQEGRAATKAMDRAMKMVAQFVSPNFVQQALRSGDEDRPQRKINSIEDLPKRFAQQTEWLDNLLGIKDEPIYDAFGRTLPKDEMFQGSPEAMNMLFRMLSPVYAKVIDPDKMLKADRVILDYNQKHPDKIYTPTVPDWKYKVAGVEYTRTDAQQAQFTREAGAMAAALTEELIDMKDGPEANIERVKRAQEYAREVVGNQLGLEWQGMSGEAHRERMTEIISLVRTIGVGRDAERKRGVVKGEDVVARRKAIERAKEAEVKLAKLATAKEIDMAFDFAREGLVSGKKDMERKRALNKLQREYDRKNK